MRTQNMLIAAAAALAAGAISSQAQVYSQNIVGYVNNPVPFGYSVQSAPFTAANGNSLTNLFQNPYDAAVGEGDLDGDNAFVWNGHSFTQYQLYQPSPTGVVDASGTVNLVGPVLAPGTAFFFDNEAGVAITNTYVGTVQIDSGSYPGTSTNTVGASTVYAFLSARIPVAGGVQSVLGLTNTIIDAQGDGLLDGEEVLVPSFITVAGVQKAHGYTTYQYYAAAPTGFVDASGTVNEPEPQISVGSGFLFNNQNAQAVTWVQSIGQ